VANVLFEKKRTLFASKTSFVDGGPTGRGINKTGVLRLAGLWEGTRERAREREEWPGKAILELDESAWGHVWLQYWSLGCMCTWCGVGATTGYILTKNQYREGT
jgi:hypothetical protein